MTRASGLYLGRVTHRRFFPREHRLSYRVWYLLADLDELPMLDRSVPGFTFDRPGPVSFRSRDHGPRDGSPLRPWIEAHLAGAGIDLEGGAIRILTLPRILGYVFNPLSVWFCHHRDGDLRALLYEVSNTYGEHHSYLVPVRPGVGPGDTVRRSFDKELFVSPFIGMAARYDFTARVPDGLISIVGHETEPDGRVLVATLRGRRVALTGRSLAVAFFRYPLLTLKVIAGIHWEALKLWRKGTPRRRRGRPPARAVTVLPPEPAEVAEASA